jgi:integrase/recombinase XerD
MTRTPMSLKLKDWPPGDRERWLTAQQPAGFLERTKPASQWSQARRSIVESAYGGWLSFLVRHDLLDPHQTPAERVTDDRLKQFVGELQARAAPVGIAMRLGALVRALDAMEPDHDRWTLRAAYNHFKLNARPTRDKLSRMVPAADLLALGISLMDTAPSHAAHEKYQATRYRDGLLIALLISCPIRLKNLAMIIIGQHLVSEGEGYVLRFTAEETKTERPYQAELPAQLTPYVERYLSHYRRPCS